MPFHTPSQTCGNLNFERLTTCWSRRWPSTSRCSPHHRRASLPVASIPSAGSKQGLEDLPPAVASAIADAFTNQELPQLTSNTNDAEVWTSVRAAYPALVELSDGDLQAAVACFVDAPPSLAEVLLKTPSEA